MVSPAESWDDIESGYENGNTKVVVSQVEGRIVKDGTQTEYTGYCVNIWDGPPGYERHRDVATYEDPRPAWELANLLTRLYEERPELKMALDKPEGDDLPRGVAERDPEQLLRDVLGYEEYLVDEALGGE
jgi:hypothetical protein